MRDCWWTCCHLFFHKSRTHWIAVKKLTVFPGFQKINEDTTGDSRQWCSLVYSNLVHICLAAATSNQHKTRTTMLSNAWIMHPHIRENVQSEHCVKKIYWSVSLRIFWWVYGNSEPSLVVRRRIPADHVGNYWLKGWFPVVYIIWTSRYYNYYKKKINYLPQYMEVGLWRNIQRLCLASASPLPRLLQ